MTASATAHPNIALVKYWGKGDEASNTPATPSLSITLSDFASTTTVRRHDQPQDRIRLNGSEQPDPKIEGYLARLRQQFAIPPLAIESSNNFPTASGLASSASGFAALTAAINSECALGLDAAAVSGWARQASASAARSVYGGFVTLQAPRWQAEALLEPADWPLNVVVAITSTARKAVSSTTGMRASRDTSPYFDAWCRQTQRAFDDGLRAVANRDFAALAATAEASCLDMHALMLASRPGLLYWNGTTVDCMHRVRALQADGVPVFFTIDAGPQLKAVCLPPAVDDVARALGAVNGVLRTHTLGLGGGVRSASGRGS